MYYFMMTEEIYVYIHACVSELFNGVNMKLSIFDKKVVSLFFIMWSNVFKMRNDVYQWNNIRINFVTIIYSLRC